MPSATSCTLLVFFHGEDAESFEAEVGPFRDQSIYRHAFEFLPFVLNPPNGRQPELGKVALRFEDYPLAEAYVAAGVDYAIGKGVDAINLSLGPDGFEFDPNDPLQIATRLAWQLGVPVVVAAGNDGPQEGTLQPLAQAPWVISVGATNDPGWGSESDLLDSSSRGCPEGPLPTVVAGGIPQVTYIKEGWEDLVPGTSFAAPKVTSLVILLSKVILVVLQHLHDAKSSTVREGGAILRLAIKGLLDDGYDPATLDPLPSGVKNLVDKGSDLVSIPPTAQQQHWSKVVSDALVHHGIHAPDAVTSDLLKRALEAIAEPMPGRVAHEVGAGRVCFAHTRDVLENLTPSFLVPILCPDWRTALPPEKLVELDNEVGRFFSPGEVSTLIEWFYYGQLLVIAQVVPD